MYFAECASLSRFFFFYMVLCSSVSTQIRLWRWPQGTMSVGLAHFNTAPTALPHRLEIVVVLDKVCSTGQGTRARITIFRPRALKYTDMNDAAARIEVILLSLQYKADVNLCHLV